MKFISFVLASLFAVQFAVADEIKLLNVSYDPTRELHADVNSAFVDAYKKETGKDVRIEQSHGGSGKQMRAVLDGLAADVVTPPLAEDVNLLQRAGLVKEGWQAKLPSNSSPYTSTIVFVVRKGNPKQVKDWADLVNPGVTTTAANPKTGGGARWIFLAAWGSVLDHGGSEDDARAYVSALYKAMPVMDSGARATTISFAKKGLADVMLAWENEAWLVKKDPEFADAGLEIVYPSVSILAEPVVAVVDKNVDAKGADARAAAEAYLKFFFTAEAQDIIGEHHYRPRDEAALKKYEKELPPIKIFDIEKVFGGWQKAQPKFFADGGEFDRIFKK